MIKRYTAVILLAVITMNTAVFAASPPSIDAKASIIMEASTGKVIAEENADAPLPPASVTKIMTLLLIYDSVHNGKIKWTDNVTVSEHASGMGGSQIFLEPNEVQTVEALTKSIAIASANDAAVAMAEYIGGSEEAFVEMMNQRAKGLGMKTAHFENACGLDTDNHVLSARDIAVMSRELITKYPEIKNYTTKWQDTITHTTKKGNTEFGLTNTNKLIKWYSNATGLKTGSTGKALYCLSATAKKDNMELIAVVMAAPDPKLRFREAIQLLDYGFANYQLLHGKQAGEEIADVAVSKGEKDSVKAVAEREFTTLAEKGSKSELTSKVNAVSEIQSPVAKGTKLGEIIYYLGNTEAGRVNLTAKDAVNKAGLGAMLDKLIKAWLR